MRIIFLSILLALSFNLHAGLTKPSGKMLTKFGYFGGLSGTVSASCAWQVTSSATYQGFPVDADCITPTNLRGQIQAPATKIPGFVIPANSPSGEYLVVVSGFFQVESANHSCNWRLTDGTNTTGTWSSYDNTAASTSDGATVRIAHVTSGSATTVQIQASGSGAACTVYHSSATSYSAPLNFDVYYFPTYVP